MTKRKRQQVRKIQSFNTAGKLCSATSMHYSSGVARTNELGDKNHSTMITNRGSRRTQNQNQNWFQDNFTNVYGIIGNRGGATRGGVVHPTLSTRSGTLSLSRTGGAKQKTALIRSYSIAPVAAIQYPSSGGDYIRRRRPARCVFFCARAC